MHRVYGICSVFRFRIFQARKWTLKEIKAKELLCNPSSYTKDLERVYYKLNDYCKLRWERKGLTEADDWEIDFKKEVTWSVTQVNMARVLENGKIRNQSILRIWKLCFSHNIKWCLRICLTNQICEIFVRNCTKYGINLIWSVDILSDCWVNSEEEKQGSRSEDCDEMYHQCWKIKILKGQ